MDHKKDLAERLPELKKIEGFPIGKDEDILALSQPPYYTACSNPYIKEFIEKNGKPYDVDTDKYHKEPFVGDVSEGKTEPIYTLHSYHTKVPYKAIMNYISHYTNENDIVLDGFCGTGMTGVAAGQLKRFCILSDLSPIASFIAYNYNNPYDGYTFTNEASKILSEVYDELSWMFETLHTDGISKGRIDTVVWSDVLVSPFSNGEFIFYDVAFNKSTGKVLEEFTCPFSGAVLTKKDCKNVTVQIFDDVLGKVILTNKQVPVLIKYTVNKKKFTKVPDEYDLAIIERINKYKIPYWFPIDKIEKGDKTKEFTNKNITYSHQLYTKRILSILAAIKAKCYKPVHHIWLSTHLVNLSILNRYRPEVSFPYNPFSGTYYIASMSVEANVFTAYSNKIKNFGKALGIIKSGVMVGINSATSLPIPDNTIDYIFTDPPFGHNLMYSELNFIWESWLKIQTNNEKEAIINVNQSKKLPEYYELMTSSFKEYYRVLKPKRWITVEFHNSKSSVWNAIQEGMSKAGFIVSQVSVLDKQQGNYNQVNAAGATKNDLVISAFKPDRKFEERFLQQAGENLEFEFVEQFLSVLPVKGFIERTDKMLYSKMLAYYIQKGYEIRYDAKSFYNLLNQNFATEDGFWFTANQINSYLEYKKKLKLEGIDEVKSGSVFLFVTDEKSALVWLFSFLSEPKSFSEISIAFNQLANIQGDNVPELRDVLEQNFISENENYRRPKSTPEYNQISEKREKILQKEFEGLLIKAKTEKAKIKIVRKEALSYGFEMCYKAKRFDDILTIAKKLDKTILENSSELNDFVEAAEIMVQGIS